ncbi:copper chaperone PCu(A)C [Pseudidiomarina tainanensis]|uniref:copper chaperone PCu(A)C n=1 Tax=Pseudidiomarina tainanensis TaxID=502365 RepID=UPI0013EEE504|nr:copper chaperone PCu(A)C [Pseudidiomarina tainanensis]
MMQVLKILLALGLLLPISLSAAEVEISNPWVKESIPGTENGAGYFTITNTGSSVISIVGATTAASRAVEVHQHVMRDGMMRMRRVPELTLEPSATVVFQPGGYHLMLFGVKNAFKPGDQVEFTLQFSDGDSVSFDAEVRSIR